MGGCWAGARPAVQMHFTHFAEVRQSKAGSCWRSAGPHSLRPSLLEDSGGHCGLASALTWSSQKRGSRGDPRQPTRVLTAAVGGKSRPWDPDSADGETGSEKGRPLSGIDLQNMGQEDSIHSCPLSSYSVPGTVQRGGKRNVRTHDLSPQAGWIPGRVDTGQGGRNLQADKEWGIVNRHTIAQLSAPRPAGQGKAAFRHRLPCMVEV